MNPRSSPPDRDIVATFDPKIKFYLVLQVAFALVATFVGILALPIWLVAGPLWANLYFPSIEARLGQRSLVYRHGVWFRSEMNLPLDKIQDVSLHHGPILDWLGLATLKVENAGGGQAGSHVTLIGVRQPEAFRAEIIARRDAVALRSSAALLSPGEPPELAVLREIRDTLLRLEERLDRG